MLRNEFFIIFATTWAVSQTIKYFYKLYTLRYFSLKVLRRTYLYSSGLPSSHTAVLTSSFLYLYATLGAADPMVFVFLVFSFLWVFEIYMQRRRYRVLVDLLDLEHDHEDVAVMKDLNGHDFIDIAVGMLVGILVFEMFNFTIL